MGTIHIFFYILAVSHGLKDLGHDLSKVELIEDVIDDHPLPAAWGQHPSSVSSTFSTRGQHKHHLLSSAPSPQRPLSDNPTVNGINHATVEDLDDDEFFLGPGNKTYKISSSPSSQMYTEPFINHVNRTYESLTNGHTDLRTQPTHMDIVLSQGHGFSPSLNSHYFEHNTHSSMINGLAQDDEHSLVIAPQVTTRHVLGNLDDIDLPLIEPRERRESVSSDSTDGLLQEVEEHLKMNSSGECDLFSSFLSETKGTDEPKDPVPQEQNDPHVF